MSCWVRITSISWALVIKLTKAIASSSADFPFTISLINPPEDHFITWPLEAVLQVLGQVVPLGFALLEDAGEVC